jgi:hypothetical protein
MTDSVAVVEASRNSADIQSAVQAWLDSNTVTSVDHIEPLRRGSNKILIIIAYTS